MLRFASGLLVGGATGGCVSHPPELVPSGTATVKLDREHKVSAFAVKRLNLLVLTLPPTDAEHRWAISFHDTRYLKQMSEIQPAAPPDSGVSISFLALTPGRTRLRFLLLPIRKARSVDPIDQQEFVLTID